MISLNIDTWEVGAWSLINFACTATEIDVSLIGRLNALPVVQPSKPPKSMRETHDRVPKTLGIVAMGHPPPSIFHFSETLCSERRHVKNEGGQVRSMK